VSDSALYSLQLITTSLQDVLSVFYQLFFFLENFQYQKKTGYLKVSHMATESDGREKCV